MYDASLLEEGLSGDEEGGRSTGGGGDDASGGRAQEDTGGRSSATGGSAGGEDESGGSNNAGASDGGSAPSGGTPATTGGMDTSGGTLTTGGKGGSTSTGGKGGSTSTGGTAPSGGTLGTGGAKTGGSTSTGGTTQTGGTAATGGKGGTTQTGGAPATGGSSGGSTATGGSGGCGSGNDCCPTDPKKTAPGVCGCGVPDTDSATSAGCVGLRTALVHRYSFSGTGRRVTDSVGTAHGTVTNASLDNTGSLTLAGNSTDQYVDLPNGIVSSLTNATIEIWLTWAGGSGEWQRVFDFGSTSAGEGSQDTAGKSYLFLTPRTGSNDHCVRATFSVNGPANEVFVNGTGPLATGSASHINLVVNDAKDLLSLYVNGTLAGSVAFSGHLSGINDVNNWLGRSQFAADPEFGGALHELRIYDVALSALQIQLSDEAGADPAFF